MGKLVVVGAGDIMPSQAATLSTVPGTNKADPSTTANNKTNKPMMIKAVFLRFTGTCKEAAATAFSGAASEV